MLNYVFCGKLTKQHLLSGVYKCDFITLLYSCVIKVYVYSKDVFFKFHNFKYISH